ncbi:MAG TPA: hypothetical protein VFQ67_17715 [Allosphingosinicella sp.]|jgi:hypothetical protein|nr:hypothetical protein [Allosphingosinicella sp.]
MRFPRLALLALLALSGAPGAAAPEPDIVVRGGIERAEIERILAADNVDTSRLSESEVADIVARVERGRAPLDFWLAYRAHVRAWERLADATERASQGESLFKAEEVVKAEQAIESTFDEVERIARAYGARLPVPAWSVPPTV